MNALEKAKLIKELNELGQQLEHKSLSLYEAAKTKKRLQDIFHLCDEPVFKNQILSFKSRVQPELAAHQFAASTDFHHCYRGYFKDTVQLQQVLTAHRETGWAFLHQPQQGWQIWLGPVKQSDFLHSEWDELANCHHWLLQQQQQDAYFPLDPQLDIPALFVQDAEFDTLTLEIARYHQGSLQIQTKITAPQLSKTIKPDLDRATSETEEAKTAELSIEIDNTDSSSSILIIDENINFPESLQLGEFSALLHPLEHAGATIRRLCALELQPTASQPAELEMALYYAEEDHWQARPVYLSMQTDQQGQGLKYLMLLGAPSLLQANSCIQHWGTQRGRRCIEIKSISWAALGACLDQIDLFSEIYLQQAETVWMPEESYAYIPARCIHQKKFINFEEAPADFSTPILLLQEHQKIRVIHGERRLALSNQEIAYPYLMLKRDKDLNWQKIHQIVLGLSQPVRVLDLYMAIQAQIIK
ncbi:hypothetical protein [Acinetobacter variabilis]|uniref:hypothetical protein n=1 Tax=Acinetobacter variabilis TaxID=70346 RepID=UPI0028999F93|nr:hypothetical protein [Acinetobacter variabilis]